MADGRRLRVGGPYSYGLRRDSDVGGEVYERKLVERLTEHGVDVIAGLPQEHGELALPAVRVDVLRHRLGLHWVAAPLVFVPYVRGLLRRGEVDVLRGHSVRHSGPSLLLGRALSRSRVPVVIHHHHFYPRWRRLEAAILRRADAVITVSEHSRAELLRAGVSDERIHVVPDGVARPPATEGWAEAWPSDSGLRLLHVGRLEARKRPAVALDALARLRADGVEASLVLAGDGPLLQPLAAETRARGLADRVRFLGRVSEEQKWRLYDSADVLLFASTLEGFGLVVAEAQSRGLPVIAAGGTATAEALSPGRSGLLAPPEGSAFAARVGELADPARRAEMAECARGFAARFDWDRCAAGVADVLWSLARRHA